MYNIRIVNMKKLDLQKNEILIKIDRSSVLGNPFIMKKESERLQVCKMYEDYFLTIVNKDKKNYKKYNLSDFKIELFMKELRKIYKINKTSDIALGCWCYPKQCHGETIVSFINKYK